MIRSRRRSVALCQTFARAIAIGALLVASSPVMAWDAVGHRAITWLALDGLDATMPAFLRDRERIHSIGWQAAEPDRWRGVQSGFLTHENAMDHFIDIEDLEEFGLTIDTINPLRYRFVRDMAVARATHKDDDKPAATGQFKASDRPPYNERLDATGQKEWAGFLPHAICEHHAKLISSFKTYRTLEKLNDPARAPQLEMAKANIMVQMGVLSHFVGDAAQPLHTTKHYNGWVGDNPSGYTTEKTFHARIDGDVIAEQSITYESLKPSMKYTHAVADGLNPWGEVLMHIKRSHALMEKTYELEKGGKFKEDEGKQFLGRRLMDAGDMLAALYNSAWKASEPTPKDVSVFIRYDSFNMAELPPAQGAAGNAASPATPPGQHSTPGSGTPAPQTPGNAVQPIAKPATP